MTTAPRRSLRALPSALSALVSRAERSSSPSRPAIPTTESAPLSPMGLTTRSAIRLLISSARSLSCDRSSVGQSRAYSVAEIRDSAAPSQPSSNSLSTWAMDLTMLSRAA
ncbi:hypothetical protein D3C79_781210 [compost metagenome]